MTDAPGSLHTIVCGVDVEDPTASGVSAVAAALARALGARLHLVHVVRDARPGEAAQRLAREAAQLTSAPLAITTELRQGSPALELVAATTEAEGQMLVLGAVGTSRSMFWVGGIAERVAQATTVPVLLVRDPAPLLAWLGGGPIALAAMVTTDTASLRVLEWVRTLRVLAPTEVRVLAAYYVHEATHRFGLPPRPAVVADRELEQLLRADWTARVGDLGGPAEIVPVLAIGRITDHLLAHPAAATAGLHVVGNRRRSGMARLSSVASGMVHLSRASLLLVPAEATAPARDVFPRYHRILAATDGSAFAAHALRHAFGLVLDRGGEVRVFRAVAGATSGPPDDIAAALRASVPPGLPPEVATSTEAVGHRDAAAAIVEAASRFAADVIVLASHGASGLLRGALGSVAQAVVQRSLRPVLIVRPPTT